MTSETDIKRTILLAHGLRTPHCRMFNNPVGEAYAGRVISRDGSAVTISPAYRITYGLMVGSGDLIGWTSRIITPGMVGQRVAVFTSEEVKTATGPTRDRQVKWRDAVAAAGGIAGIVRTPDEAVRLVGSLMG